MRTLVERYRFDLGPFGRQGCVGAYAEVARAGPVRVGERLAVERPATSRDEAVAATIARIHDG